MLEKPRYTVDDLRQLSVGDLRNRIGRISNQQSRHIAVRLWQHIADVANMREGSNRQMEQTVHKFAFWNHSALIAMLDQMQRTHFGQLIAAGPEAFDEATAGSETSILYQPIFAQKNTTFAMADKLYENLEEIAYQDGSVPGQFASNLKASLILPVVVSVIIFHRQLEVQYGIQPELLIVTTVVTALICIPLFLPAYYSKLHRALALYISFTDEFMDDEKQYEGRGLERW